MKSIECKSSTTFDSTEIAGMDAENRDFNLSARGPLPLCRSLVTGNLLLAVHPCHLLCVQDITGGTLLPLRLVYSGASAICSVAPFG